MIDNVGMWRALRRRVLTPSVSATRSDVRGFHVKSPAARNLLETIGVTFLAGYAAAAAAGTPGDAVAELEAVATRFRGFAYEGATMGFAVRDGLPLGGGRLVADFLDGAADAHIYMAYVGIGWAMARLPRFRWSKLHAPDPLLRWLVLDGYGFHQAYFHTDRYVHGQYQPRRVGWPADDPTGYAPRVVDQGIGRAMWFVAGADVAVVTAYLERFEESRRADLYAGVGLAATYAGGADEAELAQLCAKAGRYRAQLAQGAAFAAGARERASLVVEHNEVATKVLCGLSVAQASALTEKVRPTETDPAPGTATPAYELWRSRIAAEFGSR